MKDKEVIFLEHKAVWETFVKLCIAFNLINNEKQFSKTVTPFHYFPRHFKIKFMKMNSDLLKVKILN